jgi:16S rRNA (uracil1498-N3)-methyltransferase
VPEVLEPAALGDAIDVLATGGVRWMLEAEGEMSLTAAAATAGAHPIVLLIGPEGGLAENERALARARAFAGCRMGPRVMRTETAGLAALATLQAVAGDFKT